MHSPPATPQPQTRSIVNRHCHRSGGPARARPRRTSTARRGSPPAAAAGCTARCAPSLRRTGRRCSIHRGCATRRRRGWPGALGERCRQGARRGRDRNAADGERSLQLGCDRLPEATGRGRLAGGEREGQRVGAEGEGRAVHGFRGSAMAGGAIARSHRRDGRVVPVDPRWNGSRGPALGRMQLQGTEPPAGRATGFADGVRTPRYT
jgi:hypothetical protein